MLFKSGLKPQAGWETYGSLEDDAGAIANNSQIKLVQPDRLFEEIAERMIYFWSSLSGAKGSD